MATEVWLQGPVAGYAPLLMPIAHAFLQVKADIDVLAASVPPSMLWERPGGAASIGFHLRHIGGATDRLLTYARGERLTPEQADAARQEGTAQAALDALVAEVHRALDRALAQVRETPVESLTGERTVGRAALPTTTIGLLFHAAEHATRHAGQAMTTARVLGITPPA